MLRGTSLDILVRLQNQPDDNVIIMEYHVWLLLYVL